MTNSSPDQDELRAGRRELVIAWGLLAACCVVLYLASRGVFNSMMMFPHIFGAGMVMTALLSLRTARRVAWKLRLALTLAIVVVAVASPIVHTRGIENRRLENERQGLQALGGRPAPAIPILETLGSDRDSANSISFGERITLVNFWATWCSSCVAELPELEQFWQQNHAAGIDVLGVTKLYESTTDSQQVQAEIRSVGEFLSQRSVSFPVAVASHDSPAHRSYRIAALPTSILIDRQGQVVAYGAGVAGTRRLLEQALELSGSSVP